LTNLPAREFSRIHLIPNAMEARCRGRITTVRGNATDPVDYGYHADYAWRTTMKTLRAFDGYVDDTTTWNHDAATGLLTSEATV